MKIIKTKSGSYRTVVCIGKDVRTGKRYFKTLTAKSKPELKQKALEMDGAYDGSTVNSNTFYSTAVSFIESKRMSVSVNTYNEYQSRLRTLTAIDRTFVDKSIYSISDSDIQKLINTLLSPHTATYSRGREKNPAKHEMKPCSPKTVQNYYGFIHSVMLFGGRSIKKPSIPTRQIPDIYVPSDEEMRLILSKAEGELLSCIQLACFGPLREGEVCALQIEDIKGNVIHVHRGIAYLDGGGYSIKSTPKTALSNRRIEMPEEVISAIMERGFVTEMSPKVLRYRFGKLIKECGLPDFRFHDLRHYCVSTLHAQGVPDAYIMKRGGWSTSRTLQAVYRHTLADQEQQFTQAALAHFAKIARK